jgi:hypothetical protein
VNIEDNPFAVAAVPSVAVVPAVASQPPIRAAQSVAELAREEIDRVRQVFSDGLDAERPFPQRLKAATALLAIENEEARLVVDEQHAEIDAMTKNELVDYLTGQLREMGIEIVGDDVVDAEVIEG